MKKILKVLILVVVISLIFVGCSKSDSNNSDANNNSNNNNINEEAPETPEKPKTLTVGFDQNFPPMGFVGDDGEFTGFDLDLAAEVCRRLDMELILQPIDWGSKDMELNSGNIDCIWNGFTMNGREEGYTWTEPYMDNEQVIVVRPDSGIETLADLAGKIVCVQIDSSAEAALEKDRPELTATFAELVKVADYDIALMDLETGAVDAVAMDEIVANYRLEKGDIDMVILEEGIASEQYGVGFKLGNTDLRDLIQSELEKMAADGTMAEISKKWFGKDITTLGKN
jgi:polar amino acid transport system substrate-binding protein